MFNKIYPPTNEHDVEKERIKLEQLKVQLELEKQHQLIIKDVSEQLQTYQKSSKYNLIPEDGYFEIEMGKTKIKLHRWISVYP